MNFKKCFLMSLLVCVSSAQSVMAGTVNGNECTIKDSIRYFGDQEHVRDILIAKGYRLVDQDEDAEFTLGGGIRTGCILQDPGVTDFQVWMSRHFISGISRYTVKLTQKIAEGGIVHEDVLLEETGSRSVARAARKFMWIIRHLPECRLGR